MKKLILVLAFAALACLPVIAGTEDFIASSNVTINNVTFDSATSTVIIKSGSRAERVVFDSGSLTVTSASSTTFKLYSNSSSVKSIKITDAASAITCTANDSTGTSAATMPSTTGTNTVALLSVVLDSNASSYNSSCGAASCSSGYQISGSGASATCSACATLTGATSYNSTCGAASCSSGYVLAGTGSGSTCIVQSGGGVPPSSSNNNTSQQTTQQTTQTTAAAPTQTPTSQPTNILTEIASDSNLLTQGNTNLIYQGVGSERNAALETRYNNTLVANILEGKKITTQARNVVINFVTYGTKTTAKLGAGERAGVVSSFIDTFGKPPASSSDWNDVIKIANGRWPAQTNQQSEQKARAIFAAVYKRSPNAGNAQDNNALKVMAYGLRPAIRNTRSEQAALKTFANIYNHAPRNNQEWNTLRAISYSGAKR